MTTPRDAAEPDEPTLATRREETWVLAFRFREPKTQAWHDASWWLYLSWQDRRAQAASGRTPESDWGWLKG